MKYPYEEVQPNVWEPIGWKQKVCCCDCGLSHNFEFTIRAGQLFWRVKRDRKGTTGNRRAKKYKCKPPSRRAMTHP